MMMVSFCSEGDARTLKKRKDQTRILYFVHCPYRLLSVVDTLPRNLASRVLDVEEGSIQPSKEIHSYLLR